MSYCDISYFISDILAKLPSCYWLCFPHGKRLDQMAVWVRISHLATLDELMSLDIKHQWLPTSEKSGPGTTCSCDKGFKLCLIQSAMCKSTGWRDVLDCTMNAQPAKLDWGRSWTCILGSFFFFFLILKNLFGCARSSLLHVGSNSLTRNWTQVPCSSSLVSYPVLHQGSFYPGSFSRWIVKGRMEWRRNPVG